MAQSASPSIKRRKPRGDAGSVDSFGYKSMQQPILTADTQSNLSKYAPEPRTVTPTNVSGSSGPLSPRSSASSASSSARYNSNRSVSKSTGGSSWEDYDEGLYGAANRKAKQRQQAEQNRKQALSTRTQLRPSYIAENECDDDDDDMPMDEIMGSLKNSNNNPNKVSSITMRSSSSSSRTKKIQEKIATSSSSRQGGGGIFVGNRSVGASSVPSRPPIVNTLSDKSAGDDVSSLGGADEPSSNGMGRIINALKHNMLSHRPNSLTVEERVLWDAIQNLIGATRQEHTAKRRALENQLQNQTEDVERLTRSEAELEKQLAMTKTQVTRLQKQNAASSGDRDSASVSSVASNNSSSNNNLKLKVAQLEQKVQKYETEIKEKEEEHEAEVRAIQRVLAEMSTEREEEPEQAVQAKLARLEEQVKTLEQEKLALQKEVAEKQATPPPPPPPPPPKTSQKSDESVKQLEAEKTSLQAQMKTLKAEKAALHSQMNTSQKEMKALQAQTKKSQKEMAALQAQNSALQKEKDEMEKSAQTENSRGGLQSAEPGTSLSSMKTNSSSSEDAAKVKKLEEEAQELRSALKTVNTEKVAAKRDVDKKSRRLVTLERELKESKAQLKKLEEGSSKVSEENNSASVRVQELEKEVVERQKENQELADELEEKEKQLKKAKQRVPFPTPPPTPPRPGSVNSFDNDSVSSEEVETLQRSLADTVSSLENAKKIIASLEGANGSLAQDHRAKVKAKDEELKLVQNESAERKRRLDSLATELRDLQRKQGNNNRAEKQSRAHFMRLKALRVHLEKNISGLQSASVVHEVSTSTGMPDATNIDQISDILGDTLLAVTTTLEMAEQSIDEFEDQSDAMYGEAEVSSEVGRAVDAIIRTDREAASKDLKDELDQKKLAVRRLEDALKKQSDEMKRLRSQLDKRSSGGGENDQLKAEIKTLREQCATNMDVLAKKERELSVLRSSLSVDEDDAGYISDDASDQEDEGDEAASAMSASLNKYGVAEAEALATILSNGRAIDLPNRNREVETLKNDLLKASGEKEKACQDLQAERESLANAKMIISSLEKANKSMMEDLRSRLQDSNTAIQSLLDKSMEHEKRSNSLTEELEKMKKEKEEAEAKYEEELKKLKDEARVHSLRIASKDIELNDLRQHEPGNSAAEEKKDDVDETESAVEI